MLRNGCESIQLNISDVFHNKVNTTGNKGAFSYSFHPAQLSLTQLVNHIVRGKAFAVGHFADNRRIEGRFVSSQLLALDLDQCPLDIEALEGRYPIIQDCAFLMYPTPSSTPEQPKTRILFVLDEPIEGEQASARWRVLQMALMEQFYDLEPDDACKDPARLYYGCETNSYYVNYIARLPVALAAHFALPRAEREHFSRTEAQYVVIRQRDSQDELRGLVNRWLETAYQRVANTQPGERHKAFIRYALWLYGLNAGGWPLTTGEIEQLFKAIAAQWGSEEKDAEQSLRWAQSHASPISTEEHKVSIRGKRVGMMERLRRWA